MSEIVVLDGPRMGPAEWLRLNGPLLAMAIMLAGSWTAAANKFTLMDARLAIVEQKTDTFEKIIQLRNEQYRETTNRLTGIETAQQGMIKSIDRLTVVIENRVDRR